MLELRLLLVLKYVIPKWNFFLNKNFLVHAFPQKFLNYILYIYCDDFKPSHTGMFVSLSVFPQFTQHLNVVYNLSFDGKSLQLSMQIFFCFIIIRLFFCFYFLLVMNDEHVYLASHKNSDRSCLHMYILWNSFLVTLRKLILNVCLYYKVQCPKEILEKNKASENTVNMSYLTCTIFSGN